MLISGNPTIDDLTSHLSQQLPSFTPFQILSTRTIMAMGGLTGSAFPPAQQPTSSMPQHAASAPSRRDLATWWKTFKKNAKKEEDKGNYLPFP